MFSSNTNNTHSSNGPVSNVVDAANPNTGAGSHLPPAHSSHNPLSSHGNDHTHNSATNTTGHRHGETGGLSGVALAANPTTGAGSHVGTADRSHNPLSSHNDYSNNERSTNHSSVTGANTHNEKGVIGRTVDALNPTTGRGTHAHAEYNSNPLAPSDDQKKSDHHHSASHTHDSNALGSNAHGSNTLGSNTLGSNTHGSNTLGSNTHGSNTLGSNTHGTHGSTAAHAERKVDRAEDSLNPTTGHGAHVGPPNAGDHVKTSHSTTGSHPHSSTHATGAHTGTHTGSNTVHSAEAKAHDATHSSTHKPTMGEKIKGTVEVAVGKITSNPGKVADGEAKKTGNHTAL